MSSSGGRRELREERGGWRKPRKRELRRRELRRKKFGKREEGDQEEEEWTQLLLVTLINICSNASIQDSEARKGRSSRSG